MERGSIALGMVERRLRICRDHAVSGRLWRLWLDMLGVGLAWWWSSPSRFSACSISASSHCCPAAVFWFGLAMVMVGSGGVLLARWASDLTTLYSEDQDQGVCLVVFCHAEE